MTEIKSSNAWQDVLKAVIPIVVAAIAWLLGQVNSFSERLTKIEGSMRSR